MKLKIVQAESEAQYQQARELLAEKIAWDVAQTRQFGFDVRTLCEFQYENGVDEIPGVYAPPDGCFLLATYASEAAGCGAFRQLSNDECEMKRLYVRPAFRGRHIGRSLAEALIEAARKVGYSCMRLETATFMTEALALYHSLGFKASAPHYAIPKEFQKITVFMELDLRETPTQTYHPVRSRTLRPLRASDAGQIRFAARAS